MPYVCQGCAVRAFCKRACADDHAARQCSPLLREVLTCDLARGSGLTTVDDMRRFVYDTAHAHSLGGGATGVVWANDARAPGWVVKVSRAARYREMRQEFTTLCAVHSFFAGQAQPLVRVIHAASVTDELAPGTCAFTEQRVVRPAAAAGLQLGNSGHESIQAYAGAEATMRPYVNAQRGVYVGLVALEQLLRVDGRAIVRAMAEFVATLQLVAGWNAMDLEYIVGHTEDGVERIYVVDFDMCTRQADVKECAWALAAEPYTPAGDATHPLYSVFESAYMDVARHVGLEEKGRAILREAAS
jgi:hypothetical protein